MFLLVKELNILITSSFLNPPKAKITSRYRIPASIINKNILMNGLQSITNADISNEANNVLIKIIIIFFGLYFTICGTTIKPRISIKKLAATTVILAPTACQRGIKIKFKAMLKIKVMPIFSVFLFCRSQALSKDPIG